MICFLAAAAMDTPPPPPPIPIPCSVRSVSDDSEFDNDGDGLAETEASAVAPLFTCTPWSQNKEPVLSHVDCRAAKNSDGVPSFREGLAWEACGERKIAAWDANASPPVPRCEPESGPDLCPDDVTTRQDGQCPGMLPPIVHRTDD